MEAKDLRKPINRLIVLLIKKRIVMVGSIFFNELQS